MDREEALNLLKGGRVGIEEWNRQHTAAFLEWWDPLLDLPVFEREMEYAISSGVGPDLSDVDLTGINLQGVNFRHARLNGAKFNNANLTKADFTKAWLVKVVAEGANLAEAILGGTNLSYANLIGANFKNTHFVDTTLFQADLRKANLSEAKLWMVRFQEADLREANLRGVNLGKANLRGANLGEADLRGANLGEADLSKADLSSCKLSRTQLSGSNLSEAILHYTDLTYAHMAGANLSNAVLYGTDLRYANLTEVNLGGGQVSECLVYGTGAWNLSLDGTKQMNLNIAREDESPIAVDNIEVAQFIYLMTNNDKIRGVIDTITSKVILILGRFTVERKAILDAIREELRRMGLMPVVFDFDKPASKDMTGTVETLARMARFVIADLTDPSSIPHELATIVPFLRTTPVLPVRLVGSGGYSMFDDLRRAYTWVLDTYEYNDARSLLSALPEVIAPANEMADRLRNHK